MPVFPFPFIPESGKDIISQLKFDPLDSKSVRDAKSLTNLWVNAMPNCKKSLMIKASNGVCVAHFNQDDIKKDQRNRTFLKEGSVPCVFGNKKNGENQVFIKRLSLSEKDDELLAKALKISANMHEEEIKN